MSYYLADLLGSAKDVRIPHILAGTADRHPLAGLLEIKDHARDLLAREIYAFDISALNAAADLRIDTPQRIERLIEAVLRSPRQIYLEADLAELSVIAGNIRGVLDAPVPDMDDDEDEPLNPRQPEAIRIGAFVDVLGEGKANFHACLLLPSNWLAASTRTKDLQDRIRQWPPAMRAWGMATSRLLLDDRTFSIDITRRIGMSKSEFVSAIDLIRDSNDPIVSYAQDALATTKSVRGRNRILDAAWQAARFRDLIRRERKLDEPPQRSATETLLDIQKSAAKRLASFNPLSLGLPIIAMLALLQADSSDIRVTPRSSRKGARDRRGEHRAQQDAKETGEGLRIVTLNLEDRGLQKLYERNQPHPHDDLDDDRAITASHARIRHPVRGHLFLARNGIMTWRRPHWRGSLEQPALHRVIAPSHVR